MSDHLPDPHHPPPPQPAFFDEQAGAWTLSRYADVLAAFRESRLWTIGAGGQDQMETRDDSGRLAARSEMQEALAHTKVAEWRGPLQTVASNVLSALPEREPVDLLLQYSRPCCLQLAILVTGANPADASRLNDLSAAAFAGTGAARGSPTAIRASDSTAELVRYFEASAFRMGEPTFVGTAQTMARLLVNGLLALLRHTQEYQRLTANPGLMATAVEEMLRYAGIVPTLYRRAYAPLEIGGAQIAQGQHVHLKIDSANRDPDQFPDPGRFDVGRRGANHLQLGIGRNSCVGNLVIRMASAVLTGTLLNRFPHARLAGDIDWIATRSFCWPQSAPVVLNQP